MCPLASQLAEEANLTVHRSVYDADNKRVEAVIPEVQNLIPSIRKHTYAPDVDPIDLISEGAVFQALTRIDWTTANFWPLEEDEEVEPTPDDPSTSRHHGDDAWSGNPVDMSETVRFKTIPYVGLLSAL